MVSTSMKSSPSNVTVPIDERRRFHGKESSPLDLRNEFAAGREKGNVVDVQLLDLTVNLGTHPP